MLALTGNTGPYLQYATARIRSIFHRAGQDPDQAAGPIVVDRGRRAGAGAAAARVRPGGRGVAAAAEPHKLAAFLFEVASTFTTFYEQCPVLQAPEPPIRQSQARAVRADAAGPGRRARPARHPGARPDVRRLQRICRQISGSSQDVRPVVPGGGGKLGGMDNMYQPAGAIRRISTRLSSYRRSAARPVPAIRASRPGAGGPDGPAGLAGTASRAGLAPTAPAAGRLRWRVRLRAMAVPCRRAQARPGAALGCSAPHSPLSSSAAAWSPAASPAARPRFSAVTPPRRAPRRPAGQAAQLNAMLSSAASPDAASAAAAFGAAARPGRPGPPGAGRSARPAPRHRTSPGRARRPPGPAAASGGSACSAGCTASSPSGPRSGVRTIAYERGTVQSASGSSVVVRAADGTTETWNLTSKTVVRQNHGSKTTSSALSAGQQVFVAGPVVSGAHDIRLAVIRPVTAGSAVREPPVRAAPDGARRIRREWRRIRRHYGVRGRGQRPRAAACARCRG